MIGGLKKVYWLYKTDCDNCRLAEQTFEPDLEELVTDNGARWIPRNLSSSDPFTTVDGTQVSTRRHRYENHVRSEWIYEVRDEFQTPSMVLWGPKEDGQRQAEFVDIVHDIIVPDRYSSLDPSKEPYHRFNVVTDREPRVKRDIMQKIFTFAVNHSDYAVDAKPNINQSGKAPYNLVPNYEQGTFRREAWDDALWSLKRLERGVAPRQTRQ